MNNMKATPKKNSAAKHPTWQDKGCRSTPCQQELEKQITTAKDIISRYRNTLSELAK